MVLCNKKTWSFLLVFTIVCSSFVMMWSFAPATPVLGSDVWATDMENDTAQWSATGFWHPVQDGVDTYNNSHSPATSWWYGQDATGNYDNGTANSGRLVSPSVDLTPYAGAPIMLYFWEWYETEGGYPNWDQRWVQINNGSGWTDLVQLDESAMNTWQERSVDISSYGGEIIQIGFYFDTVDGVSNNYRGWYIDDVRIAILDYGVDISPDALYDFGNPGDSVWYNLTITNQGSNNDTYDLSVVNNTWATTFFDATGTNPITRISVSSGQSVNISVRVDVPSTASPGDYDFANIRVTSQNDTNVSDTSLVKTVVPYSAPWFDDMESGMDGWTTLDNGAGTEWQLGIPDAGPGTAYSPVNCWGTNNATNYGNNADILLITPPIDLSNLSSAILKFQNWYNTENYYDGGFVEISVDGGSTWSRIAPEGGYPYTGGYFGGLGGDGYSGSSSGWEEEKFDLTGYTGNVVMIRFHFGSDGSATDSGWYIDDVYIGPPPPYKMNVTPESQSSFGDAGASVWYNLTVNNRGTSNDTYDLSVVNNTWATTFFDATGTNPITRISVSSGQSVNISVRVDVPSTASPGDYDFANIIVTSQNDTNVSDISEVKTWVPHPVPWVDNLDPIDNGWTNETNGAGTEWQLGDPSAWPYGPPNAHSGTNCWGTNIVANYTAGADITLDTPPIDLRAAPSANITYYHWYSIFGDSPGDSADDGGYIEVSTDLGETWTYVTPEEGYNETIDGNSPVGYTGCYGQNSNGWMRGSVDLTPFVGNVVMVRFHFWSEPWSTTWAGWYIDDINISVPKYKVDITPNNLSRCADPGEFLWYNLTILNQGSNNDTYDLSVVNNTWATTFFDATGTNPITRISVSSGQSVNISVRVDIPSTASPGDYDFANITVTSQNDTNVSDTSSLVTQVLAPILVVDDDSGLDTEDWYFAALDANNYSYNYWDVLNWGSPDLNMLQIHNVVIWFTGNDWGGNGVTLTAEDRNNIGQYLDHGGRLYLSSSLAGYDAYNVNLWQSWYQTYLHSDYQSFYGGGPSYVLNGITGDPIGDGLNFTAHQGDYDPNLWGYWTNNTPVNGGVTFFTEPTPTYVATRADTGVYKIVYTAFDFADVNGAGNRTLLMRRIIEWLTQTAPPVVIEENPPDGSSNVPASENVRVVFSKEMNTTVIPDLIQTNGTDPGGWTFLGWSSTYRNNDTATWAHNNWLYSDNVGLMVSNYTDISNLTGSPYSWNFTITSGPTAMATGPTNNAPSNVATITITYTYESGITSVGLYYTTDNGTTWNFIGNDSTIDGSYPWTIPADGVYGWMAVGDGEPIPVGGEPPEASPYIYDGTPPDVIGTDPVNGAINVSVSQAIIITFSEPIDTGTFIFTCEPDPGGWSTSWNSTNEQVTLSHASFALNTTYWINITSANDTAGNTLAGAPYSFNFTTELTDTIPPTVLSRSPTGTGVPVTSVITITFNESMNTTSVENAFTTSPTVSGSFSWSTDKTALYFTPDSPLSYSTTYTVTIKADALDTSGNGLDGNGNGVPEGSPIDDYTWNFTTEEPDTQPPSSSIQPLSSYWYTETATTIHLSISATDNRSLAYVSLYCRNSTDNQTWSEWALLWNFTASGTAWSGSYDFNPDTDGFYELKTVAVDSSGNAETKTGADVSLGYDTSPPSLAVTSPTSGEYISSADVEIIWSGADATSGIASFSVRIDSGLWVDVSGNSYTASGLLGGSHRVYVRATDLVGHTTTSSVSFVVDTEPPVVEVTSPGDLSYVGSENVTITWTATDNTSGIDSVVLKLDGGVETHMLGPDAGEYTLSGLAEGYHTVRVEVYDRAGLMAYDTVNFTVDTVPPSIVSFSPTGENASVNTSISVVFSESVSPPVFTVTGPDGKRVSGTVTGGENNWSFSPSSPLAYGVIYTVHVSAHDAAGNMCNYVWNFTTTDMGTITGRVVDSDGNPMAGVTVVLDAYLTAVTDENGTYTFRVHAGNHTIEIIRNGDVVEKFNTTLHPGQTLSLPTVHVPPESEVQTSQGHGLWWLWLLLLALAFIVALVFIAKKKRGGRQPAPQQGPHPLYQPQPQATVPPPPEYPPPPPPPPPEDV